MEVLGGDIRTKQNFGDFKLHVEFWLPNFPPDVTGQRRANSGVYLQNRYEIQVLDTFGKPTLEQLDSASIYGKRAPDSNAGTAPETWQTYDITFRAARFNGSTKTENARVTVVWNGVTVHNNVAIDGPTGGGSGEGSVRWADPVAGPRRSGGEQPLPQHLDRTTGLNACGLRLHQVRGRRPLGIPSLRPT